MRNLMKKLNKQLLVLISFQVLLKLLIVKNILGYIPFFGKNAQVILKCFLSWFRAGYLGLSDIEYGFLCFIQRRGSMSPHPDRAAAIGAVIDTARLMLTL